MQSEDNLNSDEVGAVDLTNTGVCDQGINGDSENVERLWVGKLPPPMCLVAECLDRKPHSLYI